MDSIEEFTEPAKPTRKPKKKKTKGTAAQKPAKVAAPVPDFLAGITGLNCPHACKADRCVISGVAICAHPHKGGLQPQLQNPESLRNVNDAKEALAGRRLKIPA